MLISSKLVLLSGIYLTLRCSFSHFLKYFCTTPLPSGIHLSESCSIYQMGTHFVCPTVMCNITVESTTMDFVPISVVFCTASSLTTIIGLLTMISISCIVLTFYIFLTCTLRHCIILHLNFLHHRLHFIYMCGELLLGVLHRVGHMIYRCLQDRWILHLEFLFPSILSVAAGIPVTL